MGKIVLLVGAQDRKGDELAYVRELIVARGHDARVVDVGLFAERELVPEAVPAGARQTAATPRVEDRFDGVLGVGGAADTMVTTAFMRSLPIGMPKLMVSAVAAGDNTEHVDSKDITMMFSVIDGDGLNAVSRRLLSNAAGAICGMIEQMMPLVDERPMVAASMFGVTTPCVSAIRTRLEAAGYDVLVFHANGAGGRALEALIDAGYFVGVADVTTTEWADEVVGGMRTAGPDRLGAAGRNGIPQVVSVGAVDIVNFTAPHTVPAKWRGRNLYRHNPNATLMRTTPAECAEVGRRIAEKLNLSTGPCLLLLPVHGVSMMDAPGQPFYDPAADAALFDSLRRHCSSSVRVVEVDAHINDASFADRVADELLALLASSAVPFSGGG